MKRIRQIRMLLSGKPVKQTKPKKSPRSSHRLDAGSAGRKMEKRPLEAERLRHSGSWRQEGTDCPMLLILPRRCGIIATDSSLHHETIRRVTE